MFSSNAQETLGFPALYNTQREDEQKMTKGKRTDKCVDEPNQDNVHTEAIIPQGTLVVKFLS